MDDRIVIALVVAVVIAAHWWLYKWVRSKIDEGMKATSIRPFDQGDEAAVLRLNDAEVEWTSPMDSERLADLMAVSAYFRVACIGDEVVAFLLGMHQKCGYENDNIQWFENKIPDFFYVDRVVVDARFAGKGLGRAIYTDAFSLARARGATHAVCEYTCEPLNVASKHFHDRMGFSEMGQRKLAHSGKMVSMQCLVLEDFS